MSDPCMPTAFSAASASRDFRPRTSIQSPRTRTCTVEAAVREPGLGPEAGTGAGTIADQILRYCAGHDVLFDPKPSTRAASLRVAIPEGPRMHQQIPDIQLLLTPRQAAKALAISERKLWELTNGGQIPCVRIGRAVRYSPADLQAWIARQKKGPATRVT